MIEQWIQHTVDEFWAAVGTPEPFPRTLQLAVTWVLPLAIVTVPRLRVRHIAAWLAQRQIPVCLDVPDRALHGCTIAYAGHGCIFLDGTDPTDEHRFSLAHEVGHFLVEYLYPRQRAVQQLGPPVIEVLDGLRPPGLDERLHAVLRGVPLGVHTHLMVRCPDGALACSRILTAENRADRLALELLAPGAEVWRCLAPGMPARRFQEGIEQTTCILIDHFGLPEQVAEVYGRALYRAWYGAPSVRQWLGL